MTRVLHLLVDPEADGIAGSWQTLDALLQTRGVQSLFALTPEWSQRMGPGDAPAYLLRTSRPRSFSFCRDWLRVVRETKPDIVQIWGTGGLGWAWVSRVVHRHSAHVLVDDSGAAVSWWGRQLLRLVDAIVVGASSQAEKYAVAKPAPQSLAVIPPVRPSIDTDLFAEWPALRRQAAVPENARLVLVSGPLEPGFGLREAIWVFDILKYIDPSLWLVIVGDGSQRRAAEKFARLLGGDDVRIRFVGWTPNVLSWLAGSDLVWLMGCRGGLGLLQAAADLGVPVVARQRRDWAELVPPSDQVIYVATSDKHEWAKVSREMLVRAGATREFRGTSSQVGAPFAANEILERWVALYDRLRDRGLSRRDSPLP